MTTEGALLRLAEMTNAKTAFVGLGNRDRGDDAVGLRLIDDLRHLNPNRFFSEEQGLDGVVLDLMKSREVETVIFVDSCDCGGAPGEVSIHRLDTIGETVSTHKIPLSMLMALIQNEGKSSFLLGIQPKSLEFRAELSDVVQGSLESVENSIGSKLRQ